MKKEPTSKYSDDVITISINGTQDLHENLLCSYWKSKLSNQIKIATDPLCINAMRQWWPLFVIQLIGYATDDAKVIPRMTHYWFVTWNSGAELTWASHGVWLPYQLHIHLSLVHIFLKTETHEPAHLCNLNQITSQCIYSFSLSCIWVVVTTSS